MNIDRPPPPAAAHDQTVMVLQGGGAMGAYQAGAYCAMEEGGLSPDWFAGISIGSINAAIMAGNEPGKRAVELRRFWTAITADYFPPSLASIGTLSRQLTGTASGFRALAWGVPGFFAPRIPPPWAMPPGNIASLSHYDTSAMRQTLLEHVDFGRINRKGTRLSLGAVNVRTGNFTYFDSARIAIRPEHVMASAALPPGFPPIEIDGEYYWDGGLVSNTPLSYVLDETRAQSTLVFQVDLFSASGPFPESIGDVEERRKDIVYSSRTRLNTDIFAREHRLRRAIAEIGQFLPESDRNRPEMARLLAEGADHRLTIVHLIYRRRIYDGPFKDFEFSRRSMLEHWAAGEADARRTLRKAEWRLPPPCQDGIAVYDMTRTGEA